MKLYLINNNKINKFNLPEKIADSFLFEFSVVNTATNQLSVEAVEDKWILKTNGSTNVVINNQIIEKIELIAYQSYYLKVNGYEQLLCLYCLPTIDTNSTRLNLNNLKEITIGKAETNTIFYNDETVAQLHAKIISQGDKWILNSEQENSVYLNNSKITTSPLLLGDIIFINGLIIIWMNNYIKINNPNNKILVNNLTLFVEPDGYNNEIYDEVKDTESGVELYKDEDYFFHTPKLNNSITDEIVKIDAPPGNQEKEEIPFILTIGTSLTMMSSAFVTGISIYTGISSGSKSWGDSLPSIIMMIAMIIGSLIMPRIMSSYQKNKAKKREQLRIKKYTAYLEKKKTTILNIIKKQELTFNTEYPIITECHEIILNKPTNNVNFWARQITHDNFLSLRLGIGSRPAKIKIEAPEESFTLDEDILQNAVFDFVNQSKELHNVPITLDLVKDRTTGFFGMIPNQQSYFNTLLLQLMTLHSAYDVKLIILTSEDNDDKWDKLKFSPHCWSSDKSTRFYATNQAELNEITLFLEKEIKQRKENSHNKDAKDNKNNQYVTFFPYYVIISDNYQEFKDNQCINEIISSEINYGFSSLFISNNIKELPNKVKTFVELNEKHGKILGNDTNSNTHLNFNYEIINNLDMYKICTTLANIPIEASEGESTLPSVISMLDMYKVSKIEQLNINNRWKNNSPVTSLSVPIGVHKNGELFHLDLHEKFHGPHGLVAGMTGSGKSEVIITYLLSLAINYHPYEVQFVLIDYKGGGLAGAFENKETKTNIPHIAGTITNLDTSEMNRTLVSIESELKRRQKLFNATRDKVGESTIDIYKYQKLYREGIVDEPLSHLFIVSDEFAELKSQQPDFMAQLISTARIGRSLGIHLILATQKPTGVVNDQIWSNSKFKICLKVQDRSDSMEMLKKPDAASLKETGRFYLQVGYDDYYDIGQSAWGGAKYIPSDMIIKKLDDSINFINNTGYITKTINDAVKIDKETNYGDQLTNIVKYISNYSLKENLQVRKMWLDPIPSEIYLNNIKQKYNNKAIPYSINPTIGEFDNPKEQNQGLLTISTDSNIAIFGQPGSGKENLLITILTSICIDHSPEETNIYIIDFGSETIKPFKDFPHVGEYITIDTTNNLLNLFAFIQDIIETRKEKYSEYEGTYQGYCDNSGKKDPLIIIIINSYDIFFEKFSKYADGITSFYRDGIKYGVCFILSTTTTNSIRSNMLQNFGTILCLQLKNDQDYRSSFNTPRELIPAKHFGRGIVINKGKSYEFQTALIYTRKEINSTIKNIAQQLNQAYKTKAKKVPAVPDIVTLDDIKSAFTSLENIPLGYALTTKEILAFNMKENYINLILANDISESLIFFYNILNGISNFKNISVNIIDIAEIFKIKLENINRLSTQEISGYISSLTTTSTDNRLTVIILPSLLKEKLPKEIITLLNDILLNKDKYPLDNFILIDNYNNFKKLQIEEWYQTNVDSTSGIWIGSGFAQQAIISATSLSSQEKTTEFKDMGILINKGKHHFFKHVTNGKDDSNEK